MDMYALSGGYTLSGIDDKTQQQVISLLQEIRLALPPEQRQKVDGVLDSISEAIIKEKVKRTSTDMQGWIDNHSWVVWVLGAYMAYKVLL